MIKNIILKINIAKFANLFSAIVIVLIISAIIFAFAIWNDFYLIELTYETSKSITSTIIGAAGAFIGFFVIYLTISFENFKKNYGQYALELFRKDKSIWSLGYLFVVVIIVGLAAFIYSDSGTHFSKWLFNITCFYFLIAICWLFPFGNAIIKKSSSRESLKKLIDELNEVDFPDEEPGNIIMRPIIQIVTKDEKNKLSIISEILFHNIVESNSRTSVLIIINLFGKIEKMVNNNQIDIEKRYQIIFSFLNIIQSSFDLYNSEKDFIGVQTILATLNSCGEIIAKKKYGKQFIKKVFETIEYISQALIEAESEKLVSDALWAYYHMSDTQLTYNMPNEKETWVEDEYFGAVPLNTQVAAENDKKFNIIDEFVSFKFNAIIEKSFLCRNYYIIEECVQMLGIFTSMVVYKRNMGDIQKSAIGSMLVYNSSEAIKRFITNKYPKRFNYLYLFLSTTVILDGLKQNSNFSKSIFDTLIDIVGFIAEKDIVGKLDMQEISGLCRLIIAHFHQITEAAKYVEEIIKVQKKIKTKISQELITNRSQSSSKNKRIMINEIQKDIESYLSTMKRYNILNNDLKKVIIEYI
jgi:hypothetical protein